MKGKLRVALPANVYDTTVGQNIAYMNFFNEIGEVFLVTSENNIESIIKHFDVLAMPGGADILSTNYKMSPGFYAGKANPHYEYLDEELLMPWIKTGKPIVAICRGMQTLNVRMGGTLLRHVVGHNQAEARSSTPQEMYTDLKGHHIVDINTMHHQAIDKLAPGFELIGWSDRWPGCPSIRSGNGLYRHDYRYINPKKKSEGTVKSDRDFAMLPELIIHKSLPYIAFQYHPEEMMDDFSLSLVDEVLTKYNNNKTNYGTPSQLQAKK